MPDLRILAPANRVPQVLETQCRLCEKCATRRMCRTKAIIQLDAGESPMIDASRCFGCHKCVEACPAKAIISP